MCDHIDLSNHFFFKFLRKITWYQKLVEQVLWLYKKIFFFLDWDARTMRPAAWSWASVFSRLLFWTLDLEACYFYFTLQKKFCCIHSCFWREENALGGTHIIDHRNKSWITSIFFWISSEFFLQISRPAGTGFSAPLFYSRFFSTRYWTWLYKLLVFCYFHPFLFWGGCPFPTELLQRNQKVFQKIIGCQGRFFPSFFFSWFLWDAESYCCKFTVITINPDQNKDINLITITNQDSVGCQL